MAPKIDAVDEESLAASYGFARSFWYSDPELTRLLKQAIAGTWDSRRMAAAFQNTKWYTTHEANTRQWIALAKTDPATAQARIAARKALLTTQAAALGLKLSAGQLRAMVNNSLYFGWSDDQLRQSISKYWTYDAKTAQAGLAGQTVAAMKKTAADYGVPISDSAIQSWTGQVIAGTATADDFTEYAKQQAKAAYPPLAGAIDRGITVDTYFDPYRQEAANTLGVNPQDITLSDSKWQSALQTKDPKTGDLVPMSLADWRAKIRTDSQYGYDQTVGARQQASSTVDALAKMFGMRG